MYFVKKYYTKFFIFNAFLSSIILYVFFTVYTKINIRKDNKWWKFEINNIDYQIHYMPFFELDNNYSVSIVLGKGFFQGCDRGTVKEKNDTLYFFSVDSTQYYIYKDYLYNYKGNDKIRVKRGIR